MSPPLPIAPAEFWYGDKTLLTWPTAAVLNSRQGKYPLGSEPWVRATVDACSDVARRDHVLLTSLGMHTWELAAWAMGEALGSLVLLVPLEEGVPVARAHPTWQTILGDFGLTQSSTLLIPWLVKRGTSEKESWKARDRWILEQAKRLLPISIRPQGSLAEQLSRTEYQAKVEPDWSVDYQPRKHRFPVPPEVVAVERKLGGGEWPWLVHWTRSNANPWPGEAAHDYYRAVVTSQKHYPHDGFLTLKRIIAERRIRATRWRMPMAQPLISFTSLPPWEMVTRMRWRQRYVRPSYEPYGIAIHRDALRQFGGREVRYGVADERASISALDRLFFQVRSEVEADWEGEQEWRFRGDLELPTAGSDHVKVLVPNETEAAHLRPDSPFEVISLV